MYIVTVELFDLKMTRNFKYINDYLIIARLKAPINRIRQHELN